MAKSWHFRQIFGFEAILAYLTTATRPLTLSLLALLMSLPGVAQSANAGGATFDGPAALPRIWAKTTLADTPAPGRILKLKNGEILQDALQRAECGDTIELAAGASFGGAELPAKSCDDAHWIVIRSSGNVGAEGVRATPCFAGMATLPGRPRYPCPSPAHEMARIVGDKGSNTIISNRPQANHYRFVGIEIADAGANGADGGYYDLVLLEQADHIIVDRCWIHGTPTGEDVKGIQFEKSSFIALIDSYVSDIHSKLSAYGGDSAAIGSVTGTGPVKVVNNFLEAAGTTVLWGGGASDSNVSDIEFRHNHVFKPLAWWEKRPEFFGTRFAVKNNYETKNSVRELIEGNVFENNWAQSQKGTAILLSPKNQYGQCPGCTVHDITFRYNIVRHAANAFDIAVTLATTCRGEGGNGTGSCRYPSGPVYNVSIHDNVLEDISGDTYDPKSCCTAGTLWALFTNQDSNWPHDIVIEHNTGFATGSGIFWTADVPPTVIRNFVFRNNLVSAGNYGFRAVRAGGGKPGCDGPDGALDVLNNCFDRWVFTHNVIVRSSSTPGLPGEPYPKTHHCGALKECQQFFPKDWKAVQFVDYNNGENGGYHLQPNSPYRQAGSDGHDIGADIDKLQETIAGVTESR